MALSLPFPTIDHPEYGPLVSRKNLLAALELSAHQLSLAQQSLTQHEYFAIADGDGFNRNYYTLSALIKIAQICPTPKGQTLAQQLLQSAGIAPDSIPALPSATPLDQSGLPVVYTPTLDFPPRPQPPPSFTVPAPTSPDPRVAQLATVLQSQMQSPPPPALTQQELVQALAQYQDRSVGYLERGAELAVKLQSSTADTLRRSRPNVTHNHDNRTYSLYEAAEQRLAAIPPLAQALLGAAICCLVGWGFYVLSPSQHSSPPPVPSSVHSHPQ